MYSPLPTKTTLFIVFRRERRRRRAPPPAERFSSLNKWKALSPAAGFCVNLSRIKVSKKSKLALRAMHFKSVALRSRPQRDAAPAYGGDKAAYRNNMKYGMHCGITEKFLQ